jgi:hypothetical protein
VRQPPLHDKVVVLGEEMQDTDTKYYTYQ